MLKATYLNYIATWRAEKSRTHARDQLIFVIVFIVLSTLTVLGFQNCAPAGTESQLRLAASSGYIASGTPRRSPPPLATPENSPTSTPPSSSPSASPVASPAQSGICGGAEYATGEITAPPTVNATDRRRLMIDNKIWWPTGSYGFAFNMMDNAGNSAANESDLFTALLAQGRSFIDQHAVEGLTLVKFWLNWGSVANTSNVNDWDKNVLTPYMRTGSGNAVDGKPKLNLNQWNDRYFLLLQNIVDYAKTKGIVMQLMLLDCWHSGQYGERFGVAARDFYKSSNNSSGVNWSSRSEWFQTSGAIWNQHEKFVKKVIDTVGSRPNIIWEGCNENTENVAFDGAIATLVRSYEAAQGFPQHLIVGPTQSNVSAIDIQEHMKVPGHKTPGADKDFQSPKEMRQAFLTSSFVNNRPAISDNDCCAGQPSSAVVRYKAWYALTAGGHVNIFNNDFYSSRARGSTNTSTYFAYLGKQLNFLKTFKVNLIGMVPAPNDGSIVDANVSFAYYRSQSEYIIYMPTGGSTELRNRPANYVAAWYDPRTGASMAAGQGPRFIAPDTQDWVLYVKGVPAGQNCQLPVSGALPAYTAPQLVQTKVFPGFPHTVNINVVSSYQKISTVNVQSNQKYRKFEFEIDVRIGNWNSDWNGNPDKDWHNIFWLQRSNKWSDNGIGNVFGYVNIIKKSGQDLVTQHSIQGNESTKIYQFNGNINLNTNTTYKFKQVYDTETGENHLYVYQGAVQVAHTWGPAYASEILTSAGVMQLGVGHRADEEGPETPTPGWTYSNPVLRLYQ